MPDTSSLDTFLPEALDILVQQGIAHVGTINNLLVGDSFVDAPGLWSGGSHTQCLGLNLWGTNLYTFIFEKNVGPLFTHDIYLVDLGYDGYACPFGEEGEPVQNEGEPVQNEGEPLQNEGEPSVETGSLQVMIEPSGARRLGAQWQVDNGAYRDHGYTQTGLSVGGHMVYFRSISGWDTPSSRTVTITAGSTTTITVYYEEQHLCGCKCSKSITTNPIDAVKQLFADWLLVGLSMLIMLLLSGVKKQQ